MGVPSACSARDHYCSAPSLPLLPFHCSHIFFLLLPTGHSVPPPGQRTTAFPRLFFSLPPNSILHSSSHSSQLLSPYLSPPDAPFLLPLLAAAFPLFSFPSLSLLAPFVLCFPLPPLDALCLCPLHATTCFSLSPRSSYLQAITLPLQPHHTCQVAVWHRCLCLLQRAV